MKMASIGRRFGAAAIDLILLCVVHGAVLVYLLAGGQAQAADQSIVPILLADFALILAYGALEITGASLGKRLLRIQVHSRSGEPPGGLSLGGRWVLKYVPIAGCLTASLALTLTAAQGSDQPLAIMASSTVSGVLFFGALIDILCSLGSSRRALHDFVAGTAVVDART